mmetsp:Transcript_16828/g.41006  ORF Transcript_16828/g.41006 Transcript_16828/m.41006 type:complete len:229 (-) Transcript_16828:790-1476(-)
MVGILFIDLDLDFLRFRLFGVSIPVPLALDLAIVSRAATISSSTQSAIRSLLDRTFLKPCFLRLLFFDDSLELLEPSSAGPPALRFRQEPLLLMFGSSCSAAASTSNVPVDLDLTFFIPFFILRGVLGRCCSFLWSSSSLIGTLMSNSIRSMRLFKWARIGETDLLRGEGSVERPLPRAARGVLGASLAGSFCAALDSTLNGTFLTPRATFNASIISGFSMKLIVLTL